MNLSPLMCGIALLAVQPSLSNAEPVTLRFGVIAASMHNFESTVLDVAKRKGMLDREGIRLDIVPLAGVDHMITALDDDTVDISSTAMPYLIKGELRGSDAIAVVGGPENTIYSLVSRPEIKSFGDLKGKTIGLSLPVDIISIGTRSLLAKHGIEAADFVAKQLIGTPLRARCLKTGDCAATPLTQPDDIELAHAGYHILGNSHEVIPTLQFTVIAARRNWADRHEDALVRFARAMSAAYNFMHDPIDRSEVISMATATTGASREVVSEIYGLYYNPDLGVMPKHAEINMPGVAKVIELLGQAGELHAPLPRAQDIVDCGSYTLPASNRLTL